MKPKLVILQLLLISGICIFVIYWRGIVWEKERNGRNERKEIVEERKLENALSISLSGIQIFVLDVLEENENANMRNINEKLQSETFFTWIYERGVEKIWLNENMVPWRRDEDSEDYEIALRESAIKVKMGNGQYYEMTFKEKLVKGETEGVEWIEYP